MARNDRSGLVGQKPLNLRPRLIHETLTGNVQLRASARLSREKPELLDYLEVT